MLMLFCVCSLLVDSTCAFAPSRIILGVSSQQQQQQQQQQQRTAGSQTRIALQESLLDRFTDPKIDDPWLPLTEAGISQVMAPTLQLFWLVAVQSPTPSWAVPLYDPTFAPRGSFLAPTLVHGAGLACCWLAGCLAAEAYAKSAYEGTIGEVLTSTIKAGAFASGLLILATQFDLYRDMGGYYQLGESPETDLQITRHTVELINDIVFQAVVLLVWRVIRRKRFDEDYFGRKL